jgi:outer membrane protein assembly factor BamE (lipoprotein component of BamABCDE complex)
MKTRFLIALTAMVFTIGACAPTFNVTLGQMPSQDPGSKIEAGKTTKDEIVKLYGKPDFTGIDEDGFVKWTWTHLGVEVREGKEATITSFFNLEVSFDEDLVESYSYSRKAN